LISVNTARLSTVETVITDPALLWEPTAIKRSVFKPAVGHHNVSRALPAARNSSFRMSASRILLALLFYPLSPIKKEEGRVTCVVNSAGLPRLVMFWWHISPQYGLRCCLVVKHRLTIWSFLVRVEVFSYKPVDFRTFDYLNYCSSGSVCVFKVKK